MSETDNLIARSGLAGELTPQASMRELLRNACKGTYRSRKPTEFEVALYSGNLERAWELCDNYTKQGFVHYMMAKEDEIERPST